MEMYNHKEIWHDRQITHLPSRIRLATFNSMEQCFDFITLNQINSKLVIEDKGPGNNIEENQATEAYKKCMMIVQ
jgi:hypothetical protein